jgi:hypothetical protein
MAAGVGAVVARELDEVDLVEDRDRTGEVGEKDEARLEQRDEQQLAAGVVLRDLGPQLGDTGPELLRRQEDLTDAGGGSYDARSSR